MSEMQHLRNKSTTSLLRTLSTVHPLLILLPLAAILGLVYLNGKPYWLDETWSIKMSRPIVTDILGGIADGDVHPPTYYLFLHYWMFVFGEQPVATRAFSYIFGVGSLIPVFFLTQSVFGRVAAVATTTIVALSPFHLYFWQETRVYSLFLLVCVLAIWALFSYLQRPSLLSGASYFIFCTAALYLHNYGVILIVALNAGFAIALMPVEAARKTSPAIRRWLLLQVLVGIAYLPWLVYLSQQLTRIQDKGFWITLEPVWRYVLGTLAIFSGTMEFPMTPLILIGFLALSAIVFIRDEWASKLPINPLTALRFEQLRSTSNLNRSALVCVAISGTAILVPAVVSQFSQPMFLPRGLIFASIPIYMLVGFGYSRLSAIVRVGIAGAFVLLSAVNLVIYYGPDGTKGMPANNDIEKSEFRRAIPLGELRQPFWDR